MKRTGKRMAAVLISLCLLLGLLPTTVLAADPSYPFRDVAQDAWYSEAVDFVYERGTDVRDQRYHF